MRLTAWLDAWMHRGLYSSMSRRRRIARRHVATAHPLWVRVERLEDRSLLTAPVLNIPLDDQTFDGSGPKFYTFVEETFTDADGDPLTYTATQVGGAALPAWLGFDSSTRAFGGNPGAGDLSPLNIIVTADDGHGGTASDEFTVTISTANDTPTVAHTITTQTFTRLISNSFTFAANTFADADSSDTLIYTAQPVGGGVFPAWLNFNAATRTFSGTPSDSDSSPINVEVMANDQHGGTTTTTFSLFLNGAPTLVTPIPDQTFDGSGSKTFTFSSDTFTDIDVGDTFTFTATLSNGDPLPTWLNFNSGTRTFSGNPGVNDTTPISVKVTANDNHGAAASDDFTITLTNVNDTVIVGDGILDRTFNGSGPQTYQFAASAFTDGDTTDVLTYSATLSDGSALPAWLSFNSATRTFSGNPGSTATTPLMLKVTANDGHGTAATSPFNLTLLSVNDTPTVANTIPSQNFTGSGSQTFTFDAATFADADTTDTLTYTASVTSGGSLPAWLTFNGATRTFSGNPGPTDTTPLQITITATDNAGATATTNFQLSLSNVNDVPTFPAIGDKSVAELTPLTFTVTATDPDTTQTLTFTATNLPTGATFDATTHVFSWTPTEAQGPGTFQVTFTVNDGVAAAISQTINIGVTDVNVAPVIAISGPVFAIEGAPFSYVVPASDSDIPVQTLTVNATNIPTGSSFSSSTKTLTWSPTHANVGSSQVTFTASDGTLTTTNVATITVSAQVAMLRAYLDSIGDHFFTTSVDEYSAAIAGGYEDETLANGAFLISPTPAEGTVPIFRLANPIANIHGGGHYYTISTFEKDFLVGQGWALETSPGFIFATQVTGTSEIFRLYNTTSGKHLFTSDVGERDAAVAGGWVQHHSLGFAFKSTATGGGALASAVMQSATAADDSTSADDTSHLSSLVATSTTVSAESTTTVSSDDAGNVSATISTTDTESTDAAWQSLSDTLSTNPAADVFA